MAYVQGGQCPRSYGNYTSNGFLKVACNGDLNQMHAAICYMAIVARLLNLTLVVPKLDKRSFWADPRLPKRFTSRYGYQSLEMPPVSWSNDKYYLQQILPLFSKYKVIHFNRTDARLANNGIPMDL